MIETHMGARPDHRHYLTDKRLREFIRMTRLKSWKGSLVAGIIMVLLGACGQEQDSTAVTTFTSLASPAAAGSLAPHLAVTADDKVVMSWLEPAEGGTHAVKFSILQADAWSAPAVIAADDNWFVNSADFPSVVPISAQNWAAHWLVKRSGGTYAYDIALATSNDGGKYWAAPVTPHTDGTPTEHGFVTLFPWFDGIGAVWLDGRFTTPDTGDEVEPERSDNDDYSGMTLRFARFGYDGQLLDEGEIDNLVCDCCQTDVALTAEGPIVAYRDRTAEEIRDISVSRYIEGEWTDPVSISDDQWHIPACPVNGPTIVADGELVAVAWYGAPNRKSRVKMAWSKDNGQTFTVPILVDENSVRGRVDLAFLPDRSAMISWVAKSEGGKGQLRVRKVTADGDMGPIELVTEGEYSRNAGFPQMVKAGGRLIFAWPEPGEPRQVRTAYSQIE
jgi:hypothetical protein